MLKIFLLVSMLFGNAQAQTPGAVTYYVNPNTGATSPCGISGALTCQEGSDSNSCTSIANPCATLQHARLC